MQNHSCENSLEVGQIVVAELGHDSGVQQHQLDRTRVGSDTDHNCVPQVGKGGLPVVVHWDTGRIRGTSESLLTLNQNVARMKIPMDKVIHKNLQHKRSRKITF